MVMEFYAKMCFLFLLDMINNFPSLSINKIGLPGSNYTLASGELLSDGDYYWRIKTNDGTAKPEVKPLNSLIILIPFCKGVL